VVLTHLITQHAPDFATASLDHRPPPPAGAKARRTAGAQAGEQRGILKFNPLAAWTHDE
jgi:hypothetical protein